MTFYAQIKRKFPVAAINSARRLLGPILMDPRMLDWLDHETFFRRAFFTLSYNGIDGDYAEFGCHAAVTFSMAYRESRRHGLSCRLWAFDSFEGLPEPKCPEDAHPEWVKGTMCTSVDQFHQLCRRNSIPRDVYQTVVGYYDNTLEKPPTHPPTNLCMAYIDCDLYSSIHSVLRFLLPRLKHGMIIAFDDYHNYSATQPAGARRACVEFFQAHPHWRLVPYQSFASFGMSYIVESRTLLTDNSTARGSGKV